MTRGQIAFAIWASIQLLFFSSFGMILWRVTRIYKIVKRIDKQIEDRVNEVLTQGGTQ